MHKFCWMLPYLTDQRAMLKCLSLFLCKGFLFHVKISYFTTWIFLLFPKFLYPTLGVKYVFALSTTSFIGIANSFKGNHWFHKWLFTCRKSYIKQWCQRASKHSGASAIQYVNSAQLIQFKLQKWQYTSVNSLWPSDAIWRHRSRSTLVQVMACCRTAPSHYLNQCWLIISEVQWHSY